MPANPCQLFFAWHATNPKVVKELQKRYEEAIAWERLNASDHSPAPVRSEEIVYRQILHPVHIDFETRRPTPAAFNDASNKGLSVDRAAFRALPEVIKAALDRVEQQRVDNLSQSERRLAAIAELHVSDVRAIADVQGRQAFGVYSTAKCDNAAHADICQIVSGKQSGRSARSRLYEAIKAMHEE